MNRFTRAYNLGYIQGFKDNRKNIRFIKIDEKELLSKLYDLGYIKGYKNKSLK